MESPTVCTDKKFLCPACNEVALTVSAELAACAYRAVSELLCPKGHALRITPEGKVVMASNLRVNETSFL